MSSEGEKARSSGEVPRAAGQSAILPTVNPAAEKIEPPKPAIPAFVYVAAWISLSSGVILFNKWILDTANFKYPIFLTSWHMAFATFMTQVLARTTTVLDGRKAVKMTGRVYLRAIVPIGFFFSLSLICGNKAYLYLSVSFIQMLKATMPVAVLLTSWAMGVAQFNAKTLLNVSFIVIGVVIASFGEIKFDLTGFMYQVGGIIFEAIRLTLVQSLLSSADFKMDPLVSVYYFAPICALMNGLTALVLEVPSMTMAEIYNVGLFILLANALVAFLLNFSVVLLIGKTSTLVFTLCGVLKDILLVVASMMIFGSPVSGLQFFGYSIALAGMVYYKLGADRLKEYTASAGRSWAEFGAQKPVTRKIVTFVGAFFLIFLLLGGLAPTLAPETTAAYTSDLKGMLGGTAGGKTGGN